MANGREEEAIAFLAKYHGNGDPNSKLVRLEVEEMKEGIRQDGIDKRPLDCKSYLYIEKESFVSGVLMPIHRPTLPLYP